MMAQINLKAHFDNTTINHVYLNNVSSRGIVKKPLFNNRNVPNALTLN